MKPLNDYRFWLLTIGGTLIGAASNGPVGAATLLGFILIGWAFAHRGDRHG